VPPVPQEPGPGQYRLEVEFVAATKNPPDASQQLRTNFVLVQNSGTVSSARTGQVDTASGCELKFITKPAAPNKDGKEMADISIDGSCAHMPKAFKPRLIVELGQPGVVEIADEDKGVKSNVRLQVVATRGA
jgi:hypothetical protein